MKKGRKFNYIGHLENLVLPNKEISWPRAPSVFLDLTGSFLVIKTGVSFASGVYIFTHSHHFDKSNWRELPVIKDANPTILNEKCYFGTNSIILPTCKSVGKFSVVAAGAVVTKNIPAYEIWAGNPAKKIGDVKIV